MRRLRSFFTRGQPACAPTPLAASSELGDEVDKTGGTWATKNEALNLASPKDGAALTKEHTATSFVVQDADDEEIEVLNARRHPHILAVGNGQEAPVHDDYVGLPGQLDTTQHEEADRHQAKLSHLSKVQQEEAAKLAETRKRFDTHQRSQLQQAPAGSSRSSPLGDEKEAIEAQPRPKQGASPTMLLGLNFGDGNADSDPGFLPGGVLDDEGDDWPSMPKSKECQHEDVKSGGFDADDERLMEEILDNCE